MQLDRKERDEIWTRCEAATKGPWIPTEMTSHKSHKGGHQNYKVVSKEHRLDQLCHYVPTKEDAEFIANAKQDMSNLLNALNESEMRADVLKETADDLMERLSARGMARVQAEARYDALVKTLTDIEIGKPPEPMIVNINELPEHNRDYYNSRIKHYDRLEIKMEAIESVFQQSRDKCIVCKNYRECIRCHLLGQCKDIENLDWEFDESRLRDLQILLYPKTKKGETDAEK